MKYYEGHGNCGMKFEFKTTDDNSMGWVKAKKGWLALDDDELGHLITLIEKGRVDLVEGKED